MKKNSKPELTQTWWNSNKPKAWSDSRLEMALAAYTKGLAVLEREKNQEALDAAMDLLDQVEKHAEASEKVAGEKPKKEPKDYDAEDFEWTAEVLKKFGSHIKLERKRLEELVEEEDVENDDDVGLLGDEEAYRKYLKQKMKKMQSKTYVFAFALSKPSTPEGHRFLFHKSKNGKKLGMQILDEVPGLETKKLTWGMAGADPQVSTTLVLMLEHKQLPGMIKQGNKFLKAFKPLPFDTIKLVSAETGQELQDLPDPEDAETGAPATATATATTTATATNAATEPSTEPSKPSPTQKSDLLARLNALTPRIKEFAANSDLAGLKAGADLEAKKAALAPKNRLLTLIRDCKGMIGTNDEQAEAMLVDIESILDGGQVDLATSTPSPKEKPNLLAQLNALIPRIKEFAAAADIAGQKAGADLEAKKTALAPKNRLLTLVRDCKGMIGTNDEQAEAMLVDIESILDRGQVDVAISNPSPKEEPSGTSTGGTATSSQTETGSESTSSNEALDAQYNRAKGKFAAARSTWIRLSDQAVRTIHAIRDAMVEEFSYDPDLAENLSNGVSVLNSTAERFNNNLKLKFDAFIADPPPPPETRERLQRETLDLINEMRSQMQSDPIYEALDQREFVDEVVTAPLLEALAGMAKDLS